MAQDRFQAPDYYLMDELLTDEHKLIRDTVRAWVKKEVSPIIEDACQKCEFPAHLIKGLAEVGAFGPYIPVEYGGGGLDQISYGLIMQELERGDSGLRSTASVQSSLVMYPIYTYGSEEQRKKYLPKLASGEWMGCFGLTEPDHGSNPGGMVTNIKDKGDHYLLNGAKMWISNSPIADVFVVWAKDDAGEIRGFVLEKGWQGLSAPAIHGKVGLRASITGEIVMDGVEVGEDALMPNVSGLKGPFGCLNEARYGIIWGAMGAARACLDAAISRSKEREVFGKAIGSFQITQAKLADMTLEYEKGVLLALHIGRQKDAGTLNIAQISVGKLNSVREALKIAREARTILGGDGITGEFPVMRHMANLESVRTYEGTDEKPDQWYWFEGNFESYEENKISRLGAEAAKPHRSTYRRLTRD